MLPNIKYGTAVPEDSHTEGVLPSTQCDESPLDLSTVSLSTLYLRTVDDSPEDNMYHYFVLFNLIHKLFSNLS